MVTRVLGEFLVEKQPKSGNRGLLNSTDSSTSLISIRSSNHSQELNFLETVEDFIVSHNRSKEFWSCSCSLYYDIYNGIGLHRILSASQEHSCFILPEGNERIIFQDEYHQPILQIEQVDSSGYITRKSTHAVYSPPGCKIGEVSRVIEFLERPRYEISDVHGNPLFFLSVCPSKTIDVYVSATSGKAAHIQESKRQISMKIFQACSSVEKALLLSLVILLDIGRRTDY